MTLNKKLLIGSILGICIATTTPTTFAQDVSSKESSDIDTSDDLFEMSLDNLMNMQITVASKKAEKISDAPGMITSYSKQDIERYGYYTLKDLANITSGYSSFSTFGETNLETRGQKAGSWEVNKHLLLIDGIPVNHARANSAPLEYQVPLFGAERVEFLKGPGSALYGTSAFYGVMSITSKHLKENGTMAEGRFTYGDAGNSKRIMANASVKTDIGQTNISFSHFKKGFDGDSLGYKANKQFHFNNDNSTYLNASFTFDETKLKGLGIGMIYMNRYSNAGEHWGTFPISPNNYENWEEVISYIKYKRPLTTKLNLNSYIKHNLSTETGTYAGTWNNFWTSYNRLLGDSSGAFAKILPISGFSYKTADVEGLAELSYNINKSSSLIGGLNFFTRQELSGPNSFEWNIGIPIDTITQGTAHQFNFMNYGGSARVNVASAYLQYQKTFDVLNGLILTAGGRFDNGFSEAGKYHQISPRLGLVLKATDKLNFKALYGQALRTPGIREIAGNAKIIEEIKATAADPSMANQIVDVKAEIIKSVEAGINYNSPLNNGKSNISLAIAGFYNITTKALDGKQLKYLEKTGNTAQPNIFVNANGNINAAGFEFDAQYAVNEKIRFMFNHAFAKANIVKEITDSLGKTTKEHSVFVDVPTQKTNFSTTFTLPKRFSATAVVRHIWEYRVTKGGSSTTNGNGYDNAVDGRFGGYTMLDLNLQAPINEHFGVELQARNLLDTKWKQPSLLGQNSMIPLQRRNFMLTLYTKF